VIIAPGEKVFGALLAIAGVGIILTGHWATTDGMIADLIAGGLMLAFGVLVLLMWSFQCKRRPSPSRKPTPASSSATAMGRRSPTSISRRSRADARLRLFSNSSKREIAVGSAIPRRKACRCAVLPVDLGGCSEGII
jgi:hypothetical protein